MRSLDPARSCSIAALWLAASGFVRPIEAPPPCTCAALLEMTVDRVEDTYVGYHLEVDSVSRPEYDARTAAAREAAARPDADCWEVIAEWIAGFGDPHLFLLEIPRFGPAELDSLRRTAVHTGWTEATARVALESFPSLDPLEGIWVRGGSRYAVLRDTAATGSGTYEAIVLETDAEGWGPGELKARFEARGDGGYEARYRMNDHSTRRYRASVRRDGEILVMPAIGWGREWPAPEDRSTFEPSDPLAPTLSETEPGVFRAVVPSHDPGYRGRLDSLVTAAHERLLDARLLIVDLRGNGGGSSLTTSPLMPYIHAEPEREVPGPEGPPVVLASADNLAYFTRWKSGEDTPAWLLDLLGRMGRSFGEVVPFQDPPDTTRGWVPDTTYATPGDVAIVTDRAVGSAAEAFVLFALHSPRVTTFGEPTRGMIDYQNVGIVPVGCPGSGLYLGYPTIAASADLPLDGINATGLIPHVPLDLSRVDAVDEILAHYGGG